MKINNLFKSVSEGITKVTGRAGFKIKKNLPEVLIGGGIVSMVLTVVEACKSTMNADQVIEHHRDKIEKIKEAEVVQDEEYPYPPELAKKERTIACIQTGGEFVRLYLPTVTLGVLTLTCFLASHNIMKKRYLGAVAAYNAVQTSFDQYRKRVRERYGDDADYELRYGVEREKIETEEVNGKGKTVKKTEEVQRITDLPSDYARVWSRYLKDGILNQNWDDNMEFNLMFLKAAQDEMNRKLHLRGYVFLNEVYDWLGFEHSQLGQVVGWVDDGTGDGYIDFGLYNLNKEENRRFLNGEEAFILLDFNCDGIIWDKIPKK